MHQHWNRWRRINGAIASLTGSVALTAAWFPPVAQAAELTGWQFDPATQQLQVTIPAGTTPRYFLLAQPARIVLDLPNTQVGNVPPQQSFGGAVRQIRVGQFDANSTRIVIELSPDAELAPRQVELQQASSTQWVLRPVLADSSIAAPPASPIAAPPASPIAAPPASPIAPPPAAPAVAPTVPPVAIAPPPVTPTALPPSVPSAVPPAPAPLPPLEPNVIEIPIAPAAALPPPVTEPPVTEPPVTEPPPAPGTAAPFEADVTTIDPTETTVLPSDSATSTIALNAPPAPSVRLPDRPAEPDLPARDPIMLPPAIDSPVQTAPAQAIQVPPIAPVQPAPVAPVIPAAPIVPAAPVAPVAPPTVQAAAPVAIELPPALPAQVSPNQVTVPPLAVPPARPPAPETAAPTGNVEFGQPPPVPLTARRSSVLLPAGTVLSLRYPREAAIEIESGRPRQEVLVLQNPIRDAAGATILPAGSQVIGRFEVDRSGSRFVAQAISTGDRNIRLNGASAVVSSDRSTSREDLLVHSAIGALALTLLGGFSGLGLLGGAAAGAATTYLDSPSAIVIQPNQVFEVRLTEDVPQ